MKIDFKNYIKRITLGSLIGINLVFFITFLLAYLNPNNSILISINKMNEATIELIIFSIITLVNFYGIYLFTKDLKRLPSES